MKLLQGPCNNSWNAPSELVTSGLFGNVEISESIEMFMQIFAFERCSRWLPSVLLGRPHLEDSVLEAFQTLKMRVAKVAQVLRPVKEDFVIGTCWSSHDVTPKTCYFLHKNHGPPGPYLKVTPGENPIFFRPFFLGGGVKEIPFITLITYTTTVDGNQKSGEKTTDSDVIVQLVNNRNKLPTTSSGERRIFSINSSKGTPCCVKLPRFSELDRGRSDRCLEQHFLGGVFRNILYLPLFGEDSQID